MANFAQRGTAHDALVGQHFGGGGLRAREFRNGRRLSGGGCERRGNTAGRLELLGVLAHARQGVVRPGRGELLEIHVAVDARQQPFGAELGKALIDHASGFAEFGIAGVTQRQHAVLQLRELRRTLGAEEFVQPARLVRRIAVTVRADDHVQQLFLGDLARLVVAGLDHARLHAERPALRLTTSRRSCGRCRCARRK